MQVRYSRGATDNPRSTPIENIRKVMMETCLVRTSRDSWTSIALSMVMFLIVALGLPSLAMPAHASEPMIDSIAIKFRDGALVDPAGGLTRDEQAALLDELQTPFSHVGYTPDGAFRLQLSTPLP